ncbi:hypothetical protein ABTZ93_01365 [Streptomyces sp. NPDC097941]|uniref:hypothetical protein n=1 Tax=Streptomyces sp. NPDC097941 TaxID=3155685 RepID=UPI0033211E9B
MRGPRPIPDDRHGNAQGGACAGACARRGGVLADGLRDVEVEAVAQDEAAALVGDVLVVEADGGGWPPAVRPA